MEDQSTDKFHCMIDTNTLDQLRQIKFQQLISTEIARECYKIDQHKIYSLSTE